MIPLLVLLLTHGAMLPCTQYVSPEGSGWNCTAARPCTLERGVQQYGQCGHVLCLQPGTYRIMMPVPVTPQCFDNAPFILRSAIPTDPAHICNMHEHPTFDISGSHIWVAYLLFAPCERLLG